MSRDLAEALDELGAAIARKMAPRPATPCHKCGEMTSNAPELGGTFCDACQFEFDNPDLCPERFGNTVCGRPKQRGADRCDRCQRRME